MKYLNPNYHCLSYTITQNIERSSKGKLYALVVYKRRSLYMLNNGKSKSSLCFEIDTKLTRNSVTSFHSFYSIRGENTYVFNAFRGNLSMHDSIKCLSLTFYL